MFTKKPEKEMRPPDLARSSPRVPPSAPTMQRPVGVTRPGYKSSSSIIGADLTIIGNLVSKGEVQVDGEIHQQTLAIEQGAYFEGKSRRCEDLMAGVVRPEATPTGLTGTARTGPAF